ncbi:hypothetical protein [Streptomyces sp. NPDC029004]|uniref:hypothetical protein n=1 Tax=Streptomyces sp. NPDC029004 TaxID=3154490 RepID=UPI00340098B1
MSALGAPPPGWGQPGEDKGRPAAGGCGARRACATLKDTMVRAGQSSERAALTYQHSNQERQREVAGGIDARVRAEREKATDVPDDQASGTQRARDA